MLKTIARNASIILHLADNYSIILEARRVEPPKSLRLAKFYVQTLHSSMKKPKPLSAAHCAKINDTGRDSGKRR